VDFLEGREALQSDLDGLASWAITNRMKFNKSKHQILHLGQGNPAYTYKRGDEKLESSPAERDLGFWVDGKLIMSVPWEPKGPTVPWSASSTARPDSQGS